jgi:hypothetical protein
MAIIAHQIKNFPSSLILIPRIIFKLLPYTLDMLFFVCLHDLEGNHMPFSRAAGIIKAPSVRHQKKRFCQSILAFMEGCQSL